MNLACVFGNPIEQSKSPLIHSMFAKQCGISLNYTKQFAETDKFNNAASTFFSQNEAIGANVTMPFKHDAMKWVDELSSHATRAGAVNTIIKSTDKFIGDNTDGIGLVADLTQHGVKLESADVLLIGAGGAAKGAIPALIAAGVNTVTVQNRSKEKAQALVKYTNEYADGRAKNYLPSNQHFDIVINATSLSLVGQVPELPITIFKNDPAVYDMVYQSEPTVFLKQAASLGCIKTIDGLGMLVNQAAQSFFLWFGEYPNTDEVLKYLRENA